MSRSPFHAALCRAVWRETGRRRGHWRSAPMDRAASGRDRDAREIDRGHHHRVAPGDAGIALGKRGQHVPVAEPGEGLGIRRDAMAASCAGPARRRPAPARLIASIGVIAPAVLLVDRRAEREQRGRSRMACGRRRGSSRWLGANAGRPSASSTSTAASSFIISASTRPIRAPRRIRSSRMSARSRETASIRGDQRSYSPLRPFGSAPASSSRSNMSRRFVSIATCSACGRPPQ